VGPEEDGGLLPSPRGEESKESSTQLAPLLYAAPAKELGAGAYAEDASDGLKRMDALPEK